jgi:ribosomal protein L24E
VGGLVALCVAAVCIVVVNAPTGRAVAAPAGWNIVTAPTTGSDDIVLGATCASATACWSVGLTIENISSNSTFTALTELWNGTAWSLQPSPAAPDGDGYALFHDTCTAITNCWAVGTEVAPGGNPLATLTENWNGSAWTVVPSPTPAGAAGGLLENVSCVSASDCWAVGFTSDQNGEELNLLTENWNGSAWTIVPAAPSGQTYDQLTGVTCLSASNCWAVGSAGPSQQDPNFLPIFPAAAGDQGLIEHWDGATWTVVPSYASPDPGGGYLSDVTCVNSTDCWVSGSTTDSNGDALATLMENWDGSTWSVVPSPVPPNSTASILASVSCLSASQCWAVGSTGPFGGGGGSGFQPNNFIEMWNGTAWSIQPSPNVTALSFLNSVTCGGTGCWAVGGAITDASGSGDPGFRSLIEQMEFPPPSSQGFLVSAGDGGVFNFGNAAFAGSMGGTPLNKPVVGIAATPDGHGYWEVASDGGIFTFGDASFYGSMGGTTLNKPVVGIAATPDGHGYWEVASDGGIFAFGDAGYYGSMGGAPLNKPVVGIAATPDGHGYWEVASDGGIFTFGDADFYGSPPGQGIASQSPVVGMLTSPQGAGYWLVSSAGGVFAYGDAVYLGSLAGLHLAAPITGISS